MNGYVLFQMWGPFRESLINGHLFYVEQAQKRLLAQFNDIEAEADRASEEWLEKSSQHFHPDLDPSDFYEAAHEAGIEFYGLLSDMREQTRLSVVAGMFHEWDKQLRDWMVREIRHWNRGEGAALKVWSVDFGQIADFLESFGWKVRKTRYFPTLEACRLVVNVYKHGDGKSLDDMRSRFPEYLEDPFKGEGGAFSSTKHLGHTHLKVSDDQIQNFSAAIVAFWRDVPENVSTSDIASVPDWFEKAILKDRADAQNANQK